MSKNIILQLGSKNDGGLFFFSFCYDFKKIVLQVLKAAASKLKWSFYHSDVPKFFCELFSLSLSNFRAFHLGFGLEARKDIRSEDHVKCHHSTNTDLCEKEGKNSSQEILYPFTTRIRSSSFVIVSWSSVSFTSGDFGMPTMHHFSVTWQLVVTQLFHLTLWCSFWSRESYIWRCFNSGKLWALIRLNCEPLIWWIIAHFYMTFWQFRQHPSDVVTCLFVG